MTSSGRVCRAWIIPVLAAASSFAPRLSHAGPSQDTTHACIAAFDDGQRLRSDGKLRAAHDKLVVCSQRECPAVLREDCAGVLREVEAATPSIVLSAADRDGHDLTDVEVTLDGKPLTTRLDGRALTVDPGKLALEFTKKPWAPVKMEIVVREGDKNRAVKALLGPPKEMADDRHDGERKLVTPPRSLVGWAVPVGFGIAGVGAIAIAAVTRIRTGNEADDLMGTCAPNCPQADRDRLSSDLVVANVALGIGIGCVVVAAASWFVLAPRPVARANGIAFAW